jgi:hypothetical protein
MNKDMNNHNRFLSITGIAAAFIFGILTVLGSGGGGDDEGGGGGISVGLLPTYNYNINTTAAYDSAGQPSNGITVSVSSIAANVRIDPHPVTGTFSCDPATDMCALNTINTSTLIDLFDASSPDPIVGNLSITIPEQVIIGVSGLPVIGTIRITQVPGGDFIELEMATCASGAGVNISFNGLPVSPISCFSWQQFEQLFDTSEDPVLIAAVFGFQVIDFLFEQVNFVTEVFGFISDEAVALQENGTISETCDAFSLVSLVPPTNVADQGMRSLSWTDVNTDGNVGPGDSFLGSLEDCWISPDQLLNGLADFTGYVENIDQNRGVITTIGFTSVTPPNPGGVFFNGFSIAETEVLSPPNAEITNVIGVEGGFSILFTEP